MNYGRTTPDQLDTTLLDYAKRRDIELEIFYTNLEGEAINKIYRCADLGFDGLVMNPAGFSYSGYALKDCIKGAGLPYVEIHISNVAKRNIRSIVRNAKSSWRKRRRFPVSSTREATPGFVPCI